MMVLHFFQGQMLHGTPTAEYLGARHDGLQIAEMQIRDLGARLSKVLDHGQYLGARHDGLQTAEMHIMDHAELLGDDVQKLFLEDSLKTLTLDHDEPIG